ELLHAEVSRYLRLRFGLAVEVLEGNIAEADFARSPGMEGDGSVAHHAVVGGRVAAAPAVQRGGHHVGIDDDVERVPIAGLELWTWRHESAPASAAASACCRRGRRRRLCRLFLLLGDSDG